MGCQVLEKIGLTPECTARIFRKISNALPTGRIEGHTTGGSKFGRGREIPRRFVVAIAARRGSTTSNEAFGNRVARRSVSLVRGHISF